MVPRYHLLLTSLLFFFFRFLGHLPRFRMDLSATSLPAASRLWVPAWRITLPAFSGCGFTFQQTNMPTDVPARACPLYSVAWVFPHSLPVLRSRLPTTHRAACCCLPTTTAGSPDSTSAAYAPRTLASAGVCASTHLPATTYVLPPASLPPPT